MSMSKGQVQMTLGYSNDDGRPESDFYQTPECATIALLANVHFGYEPIWEPACGAGAISEVLKKHGRKVISTDLYDYDYGESGVDFLTASVPGGPLNIITNPPFSQSYEFAEKVVRIAKEKSCKAVLLNRVQWLEGIKRKKMFEKTKLSRVLVFSRRLPIMNRPNYSGKKITSMIAFAWYVWDFSGRHRYSKPEITFVDWKDYA